MIYSNKKHTIKQRHKAGFTLVEVLLALGVLALSISILSSLQTRSLYRVFYGREEIDRVFLVKQSLYSLLLKPEHIEQLHKEQREDPEMSIETTTFSIPRKSALFDLKNKLTMVRSQATWSRADSSKTLSMISFVFTTKESASS